MNQVQLSAIIPNLEFSQLENFIFGPGSNRLTPGQYGLQNLWAIFDQPALFWGWLLLLAASRPGYG
jgi:hypothetical protein